MVNGKVKSIQHVIEKVFRDTGLVEGVDLHDAIEWAGECVELIGAPQSLTNKTECITITNGRGNLPCDLHLVMQSRVKTGNGYSSMSYATNNFHRHCSTSGDVGRSCSTNYTLSDDCIFTSFSSGVVEIAYRALPTDKNGWPTVPDDIKFIKAVEYYIREKIDYKLWRTGKLPQGVYEKTVQDQVWYLGAAQTRMTMPSVDEMINIKNNWLRLIPKINQAESFFSDLGIQEQRNIHNGRNSNVGSSSNEVNSHDYFDYLDQNII
tara:strand:- start:7621 stop:8412 length:792 start_codon:yes stop_codon:yes gene_type:complete